MHQKLLDEITATPNPISTTAVTIVTIITTNISSTTTIIIKHKNIINFARAQKLGWYGHIERMKETRMVKAIHSWKPISKRPTGRPKIRWEDDVNPYPANVENMVSS